MEVIQQESPQDFEEIADFVVSMIQAFLRTGYYLPDHPEAKRAKEGLHDKFVALTRVSREVTFLMRSEDDTNVIQIEGLSPQALRLRDLMVEGMANTYNPRFVSFLDRKQLISLSISAQMGPSEFSRFIDLMSEPAMADIRDSSARVHFTKSVKERRISHLSFVFNEDLIVAERNLPWRANLALSRMKKDLYLIPIYRRLSPEDMRRVRQEVLADILRPLHAPELVYAFLMNIDLATSAELGVDEAEDLVFSAVDDGRLVALASIFTHDAISREKKYLDVLPKQKFGRILRKVTVRLNKVDTVEARAALEEMFRTGLVTMEQLPMEVRDLIRTAQIADAFVEKQDSYLAHLDDVEDDREYRQQAGELVRIVPVLLERRHIAQAISIVEKLYSHLPGDSDRAAAARELMGDLVNNGSLDNAAQIFLTGPKEERVVVSRIFQLLGGWSLPHLMRIVREADDVWRRKQAAELVFKTGPSGTTTLLEELGAGRLPAETLPAVIRVLGECTVTKLHPRIIQHALTLARSDDPELRREALGTLARLDSVRQFEAFTAALDDPDPSVQRQAVRCLGTTGNLKALTPLRKIVLAAEKSGTDEDWDLAAAAIDSCGRLFEGGSGQRDQVAAFLRETVERGYPKGTLKRLVGRSQMPPQVLIALVDALGRVGDAASRQALERLARERDRTVASRAREALRRLEAEGKA